ncbi:DUF86 domain-containing protein [Pseudonocardia sediminis]|uniref:HepT-like ribonuclease domain-containing protein n=1 Tax=Pseudonocardia sediminis TaxID=1397368 RepID=UPI001A9252B3|nr:HepT-like ribonuclease domain-containing protein [Pseudonocardia sediminis]
MRGRFMLPEDRVRLHHLREAAEKAVGYSRDRTRIDLDRDELLRLALTKLVEIVGEAAKHVSPEWRDAHPDVPWSAAARMRDRLVHHYFDIDRDVLWATVTVDLPGLLDLLPRSGENTEAE